MKKVRQSLIALTLATTLGGAFYAGRMTADQPHMQSALDSLQNAKTHLEKATADKGGHRNKAMELTKKAINQVEAGIKYDRRH